MHPDSVLTHADLDDTDASSLLDRARAALAEEKRVAAERDDAAEKLLHDEVFSAATTRLELVVDSDSVLDIEWTVPQPDSGHLSTTAMYEGLWWRYTTGMPSGFLAVALDACDVCGSQRWRTVADLADVARVLDRDDTDCDACMDEAAELALAPEQRAETGAPHPAAAGTGQVPWLDRADEHADSAHDSSDPTEWWHHAVLSAVDSLLVTAHMLTHRRGEVSW